MNSAIHAAHAINVESTWLYQAAFLLAVTFLVSYSYMFAWWNSLHGRCLALLAIAIIGYTLPDTLEYWHVIPAGQLPRDFRYSAVTPSNWGWFEEQCAALVPVVFLILLWQLWSPRLARLRSRVRPAGHVDAVRGGAHGEAEGRGRRV